MLCVSDPSTSRRGVAHGRREAQVVLAVVKDGGVGADERVAENPKLRDADVKRLDAELALEGGLGPAARLDERDVRVRRGELDNVLVRREGVVDPCDVEDDRRQRREVRAVGRDVDLRDDRVANERWTCDDRCTCLDKSARE